MTTETQPAAARVIGAHDSEWPSRLNELPPVSRPDRLWVLGSPLDRLPPAVAIVGTRRPSGAGLEVAVDLARGLVEAGFSIVSGFAVGIDCVAHRAAIEAGGRTIAVLGCGVDVEYPRANSRLRGPIAGAGALISEYAPGTRPHAHHFPERNRLIAALSHAVIFVEGSLKSGGRITARIAAEIERDVFAVPGSVRNPMAAGPNELIRTHQATMITDPQHLFDSLAPGMVWQASGDASQQSMGPKALDLSPLERRLLEVLDDVPLTVDRLGTRVDEHGGQVGLALAMLEVRGFARRRPMGYEITSGGVRVRRALAAVED